MKKKYLILIFILVDFFLLFNLIFNQKNINYPDYNNMVLMYMDLTPTNYINLKEYLADEYLINTDLIAANENPNISFDIKESVYDTDTRKSYTIVTQSTDYLARTFLVELSFNTNNKITNIKLRELNTDNTDLSIFYDD